MTEPQPTPEVLDDATLVQQLHQRREERLRKAWQSYAPRNPIASDLHDCARYQVMRLLAWEVREVPDLRGLQVIEQGRVMEPAMIRQLQDEGWDVVELQVPFEIRQPVEPGGPRKRILSGKLDGKIRVGPRELLPFDTKDTGEHVLHRLEDESDLRESPWTRKWWRQMQSYMLGEGIERSLLLPGFRGERKPIIVHLDYGEAEKILQLCAWAVKLSDELVGEDVTHANVDDALNARQVDYHPEFATCRMCPFKDRACFPPDPATKATQLRPDLRRDVARYAEIKPIASEVEKLRKRIKTETEGVPVTVAGEYVVEGEERTRRMKAKPAIEAHEQHYWAFDVRKTGADAEETT